MVPVGIGAAGAAKIIRVWRRQKEKRSERHARGGIDERHLPYWTVK
jgi:hypothetical protein